MGRERSAQWIRGTIALLAALFVAGSAADVSARPSLTPRRARAPRATAKRIDVSFNRADIHNVLRFFARIGNVNIVAGDGVRGRVTLRLRRMRWTMALRVVLKAKGLELARVGKDIYLVAPRAKLAKQRGRRLSGRARCLATAPLVTRLYRLSYADAAKVAVHARATLRSRRGSVTVDRRTNTLIVRDVVGCR
jgi:type IV pilus assembly protein PilQ